MSLALLGNGSARSKPRHFANCGIPADPRSSAITCGKRALLGLFAVVPILASGCSTLLAPEETPVPGAAATLTRSINTPIPTPVRTPAPAAGPSPSPRLAVAVSPGASPTSTNQGPSDADVDAVQSQLAQIVSSPDMRGAEGLLLDHVAMSTPQGGSVMDSAEAAQWLREHAGPGIKISQVDRGTQEVMLRVQTSGWPQKDPIQSGQVTFSLRRYDASGRQDESGGGEWKIDVIEVD